MQATVYFKLSQNGQLDAIRRNLPAAQTQHLTGDIEERDLSLMTVTSSGELRTAASQVYSDELKTTIYSPRTNIQLDSYPSSVRDILDLMHANLKQQVVDRDAAIMQQVQNAKARLDKAYASAQLNDTDTLNDLGYVSIDSAWPGYQELHDHPAWQLRRARIAANEERIESERKQKEADEAAKEEAKRTYIAQWISEHGTDSQRARFADGLLCRDEAISAIAAFVLDPFGPALAYRVCEDTSHKCHVYQIACLDAESYESWSELKAKLSEGSTWDFFEIVPCLRTPDPEPYEQEEDDDLGVMVIAVELHIPEGPFKFKRTIAL